jgi:hypothetical protein
MCIVFTCGETEFTSRVPGLEAHTVQCHNCGNVAAHVLKRKPWFTFCFVPVLPLSLHGYEDVVCDVCRFAQPLVDRQDVIALRNAPPGQAWHPLEPQPGTAPPAKQADPVYS